MSEQALAELSNNALYSATVVYALALLAHAWEWAMARQLPERPAEVGHQAQAALVGRSSTAEAVGPDSSMLANVADTSRRTGASG
ncbi:MAG: hypothetical protein ACRDO2_09285, partial [Nocardioidaceae bacterium]